MTDDVLINKKIENALMGLMEFCDSVQIVATTTDEEGTQLFYDGRGNYYARQASVRDFLNREETGRRMDWEAEKYNEGENL